MVESNNPGMVGIFLMGLLLLAVIGLGSITLHYAMSTYVNPILSTSLDSNTYQNATELAISHTYLSQGYSFYLTSFVVLLLCIFLWVWISAFRRKQQYGEQ